ncbi:MAG: hypothetical protein JW990_05210 [Thermoleophilia bacterium]|nr:hypothetical protein [Thermoleophilia bacterium]
MSEDQELRERLGRLAGRVDPAGVWASIEARAAAARTGGAALGTGHAGFLGRMRAIRTRTVVFAALAVVLLAAVAVGGTMAALQARGSQVLVIGDDPAGMGAPAGSAADPGKWERLPLTWDGGPVYSIVVDPSDLSVVYAGTGEGVYKSTDGAESWSQVFTKGAGRYFVSLDPGAPEHVYASWVGRWGGAAPAMWRSNDGGHTWKDLSSTVLGETIRRDWEQNNGGLNGGVEQPYAQFDTSTIPSTAYVFQESGWLRSTDGGETWAQTDEGEADDIQATFGAVSPDDVHSLLGTDRRQGPLIIVDSADGTERVAELAVADPSDPAVIYAGTQEGLYRSTNGGRSWERKSHGLNCTEVTSLLVAPDSSSTLYALTPREMWKSTDGGATWHPILAGAAMVLQMQYSDEGSGASWSWESGSLVVAPSSPSTLYAWTRDGLLRSEDGGGEWTHLDPEGLPPVNPEYAGNGFDYKVILVSAADPDIVFVQSYSDPIVRSTDGGQTWSALPDSPYSLVPDPNDPSVLYGAGLLAEDGQTTGLLLRKSADSGATWTTISPAESSEVYWVKMFVDASRTPSVLYAVGGDGSVEKWAMSRSDDGGATWHDADPAGPTGGNCRLLFDPASPGTLYADTYEVFDERVVRGLYHSTDGGDSWESIIGEMASEVDWQVVMDPVKGTLYAYCSAGVFRWDPDAE